MTTPTPAKPHPLDTIIDDLATFLSQEILEDEEISLESSTPLLQLGIIDSLTMVSLLSFIETKFGVMVPNEAVTPENLESLTNIAQLISQLQDRQETAVAIATKSHPLDETLRVLEAGGIQRRTTILQQDGATQQMHTLSVSGEQPTWVFLPGGSPSTTWAPLLRSLMDEQAAIAIDLAGFGLSITDQMQPTYQNHLNYTLALLQTLTPPPYVLVGSSAGAMLATEIARRHPDWVKALVIIGFGLIEDVPAWWQRLMHLVDHPEQFLQAAYHRPPKLTPTLQTLINDVISRPAYRSFLQDGGFEAMTTTFERLTVPTLFVAGQEDQIIPPAAVTAAASRIPGATIEWLARCGHFPPTEQPEELLYLIQTFLQTLD
ncbi:MAG: alpha/beta fold hydrolase [Pleurocapsa sp. MO_226.B13]|nr:alpha/beta fold hydrolase [Pleurocapsa sp. MO_226.B13]